MEKQIIIEKTKSFIKQKLDGEATGHDYWHIQRVYELSIYIAEKENADLFVVSLAALLHDVADHKFHNGNSSIGAQISKEWLDNLGVAKDVIQTVTDIVETISFKAGTNHVKQKTLEGMIVQDADRLDAIGAIGIARTFAYGGNKNREIYNPDIKPKTYENYSQYTNTKNHSINHFYEKLLLLKDQMNTKTGKKIALERHQFMELFLHQFYKEWDCHDLD